VPQSPSAAAGGPTVAQWQETTRFFPLSGLAVSTSGLCLWASIALAKIASDAEAVPTLIEIPEDKEVAEMWELGCESLAARRKSQEFKSRVTKAFSRMGASALAVAITTMKREFGLDVKL